jgi:tRNA A-37 threonylcarbamoyl transferase component Bud32
MALRSLPGGYEERESGRVRLLVRSDAADAFVRAGALAADAVHAIGTAERTVGGGRATATLRTIAGVDGRLLAKRLARGGALAAWLPDLFAFDRAYAELLVTETLRGQGVRVPAIVAVRMRAWHRFATSGSIELFVAWVEGGLDLLAWLREARPHAPRSALFERLGTELRRMHEVGVVHDDLNVRNVLVDPNGAPWLVDFGASSLASATPERRAANLARLMRSAVKTGLAPGLVSRVDLARVVRGYGGELWKDWWKHARRVFEATFARHALAWRVAGKGRKAGG